MPIIKVRVYDTQLGDWSFQEDIDATNFKDIMDAPGFNYNPGTKYVDGVTKQEIFKDPTGLVSRDIDIFATPTKSKAGK